MSKLGKYSSITFTAISVILSIIFLVSCSKKGTDSGMDFQPGIYAGTYQVQRSAYDPPKVDTMEFTFYGGGAFYMQKDSVVVGSDTLYDLDRQFCDVGGEFEFIGPNDNIRIQIPEDYPYTDICVHEENPTDEYTRTYSGNWIVFSGDDDSYRRRITLWEMMDD